MEFGNPGIKATPSATPGTRVFNHQLRAISENGKGRNPSLKVAKELPQLSAQSSHQGASESLSIGNDTPIGMNPRDKPVHDVHFPQPSAAANNPDGGSGAVQTATLSNSESKAMVRDDDSPSLETFLAQVQQAHMLKSVQKR